MKVIVLHPPMYPVNQRFYDLLGRKCDLIVYQFGEHPVHHTNWTSKEIHHKKRSYKLKMFGTGAVSFSNLINPSFMLDILKEKPDIVLSIAFWIPSLYISLLKIFKNFKLIILTNMIASTEKNVSISKQIVRNIIANRTDAFISASDLTTAYLSQLFPQTKIYLSLQTIDILKWNDIFTQLENYTELKNKLDIPPNKKIMLGIGNFIEKKNWKSVLYAMQNIDDLFFILIGGGEQEDEYKKIIQELSMENKVSIVGRKEGTALLEYFKVSDFLIFPSYYDQYGFVVPEALTCGLPIICSKNAGASTLIENGTNGYIVDPTEDMTNVIHETMLNLEKMQQNAKVTMLNYTLENRVDEFIDIFERLHSDL